MTPLEAARRLAEDRFGQCPVCFERLWPMISAPLDSHERQPGHHKAGCLWLMLPQIVAALETFEKFTRVSLCFCHDGLCRDCNMLKAALGGGEAAMKTLDEITKLLDEVEAGKMTRHDFHQQAFGMTPEEAIEYGNKIDAENLA